MTATTHFLSSVLQRFDQFPSLRWLLVATVVAVSLSITYHYVYTDLNVDSGSYSYPAYAISRDGDPNENQSTFEGAPDVPRLVVLFSHFTKNSIRVLPLWAWFSTFEPSIAFAKAYAFLEMAIAWAIFAFCAWRFSRSKVVFACLSLLFLLDAVVLDAGINDLRPDLFTALLALFALFFLSKFYDDGPADSRRAIISFTAALFCCFLLALTHPVSVVSLAVLLIYASLRSLDQLSDRTGYFLATLLLLWIVSIATFLLKGWILGFVLASEIDPKADLWGRVEQGLLTSPLFTVKKEYWRWSGYLLWVNVHLLLLFAVMLLNLADAVWSRERRIRLLRQMPLTLASVVGVVALLLLDPHPDRAHAMAVTPFLLLAASELPSTIANRFQVNAILRSLVVIGAVWVTALAASNFYQTRTGKETNFELQQRLRSALAVDPQNPGIKGVAFGPAELWPYIGAQTHLLMLDRRSLESSRIAPYVPRVDYVIVNDSYRQVGFMEKLTQAAPDVEWVPLSTYLNDSARSVVVFQKRDPK